MNVFLNKFLDKNSNGEITPFTMCVQFLSNNKLEFFLIES